MSVQDPRIVDPWFALRVKSRQEKMVATIAHYKGLETFLPLYKCRRRWSDRIKLIELPLFPGYLFCRANLADRLPILSIPGVLHFVGQGRIPIPIDEAEIAAIRAAITSGLRVGPWPFLQVGQRVRLVDGPLAGLEGLFLSTGKCSHIIVSVTLLRRSVAVEVERNWVSPLSLLRRNKPSLARPLLVAGVECM